MTESTSTEPPVVLPYQAATADSLTKYDLGILAVRLFGLNALLNAVAHASYIPNYFAYPQPGGRPSWLLLTSICVPCAAYAVIGVVLLRWAGWIVRRLFPEFAAAAGLSVTGRDIQAVLFSVVGVWLVASTLAEVGQILTRFSYGPSLSASERQQMIGQAAGVLVQLVVGVLLFARAKALSALWHRIRYAGVTPPPSAAP